MNNNYNNGDENHILKSTDFYTSSESECIDNVEKFINGISGRVKKLQLFLNTNFLDESIDLDYSKNSISKLWDFCLKNAVTYEIEYYGDYSQVKGIEKDFVNMFKFAMHEYEELEKNNANEWINCGDCKKYLKWYRDLLDIFFNRFYQMSPKIAFSRTWKEVLENIGIYLSQAMIHNNSNFMWKISNDSNCFNSSSVILFDANLCVESDLIYKTVFLVYLGVMEKSLDNLFLKAFEKCFAC